MANYWASKNRRVTILTISQGSRPPAYALHPQVVQRDVGFSQHAYFPLPDRDSMKPLLELYDTLSVSEQSLVVSEINLIAALRHALVDTRPEQVVSFMDITNLRVMLAVHGLSLPVIVSERCDPYDNFLGEGRERLRWRLYPKAKYLTVFTAEILSHFYPMVGERGRVIPNMVLKPGGANGVEASTAPLASARTERTLVAMGRLAYEKGFDLLLHAFARVAPAHPSWRLRIFGEGELRGELEKLARELGLSSRVSFPGFTTDPAAFLRQSDLFVASSRSEGFSNVIAEALACGLPVVSFDCPSGPRHIIRDGVDGLLVPARDVAALAASLDRLMSDGDERARLAARAPEVLERFGIEKIMALWEELITADVREEKVEAG